MKKQKPVFLISILIIIFFISFISIFFSIINIGNSKIYKGISINNIDMSGKSKEEAVKILNNSIKSKIDKPINLKYNDYNNTLYYSAYDVSYDINSAVDKAYLLGRKGNIVRNNYAILKFLLFKKNINIKIEYNDELLDKSISDISSNLPGKLVEPNYSIEEKNLVIKKGNSGIVVDESKLKEDLINIFNNISSQNDEITIPVISKEQSKIDIDKIHSEIFKKAQDAYYEKSPFKVYPEVIGIDFDVAKVKSYIENNPNQSEYSVELIYTYPETTLEKLDIDIFPDLLGSFSTRYDASNKSRSNNLQLATNKINGQIIASGKEFSYNQIVGERTISAGYKEAKIYSNGEVVDGIGGGVCQISSTLYNAAIFSNLKITERYNHQFQTSYAPAGRDATVSYGYKDLKFINNRSYPIKIVASTNSGVAKIEIYGIKEPTEYDINVDVKTISNIHCKVVYENSSDLAKGEEKVKQTGVNGIIVEAYKIIKKNGVVISKELLSKDTYNSMDKIILKGTANE